ncbi:hypothetical protein CASFOL_010262 [Castilleja foliolosa]|uniref:Uncharacterized protein n=1 Tax=Castilleja foliolosa TaxID=1961234 RepID=A0ABD3DTY0_9LAMI
MAYFSQHPLLVCIAMALLVMMNSTQTSLGRDYYFGTCTSTTDCIKVCCDYGYCNDKGLCMSFTRDGPRRCLCLR